MRNGTHYRAREQGEYTAPRLFAPTRAYARLCAPVRACAGLHAPVRAYTRLYAPYTRLRAPTRTHARLHAPVRACTRRARLCAPARAVRACARPQTPKSSALWNARRFPQLKTQFKNPGPSTPFGALLSRPQTIY